MEKWYDSVGNDRDVVLSTMIRMARNFSLYPFPSKASCNEIEKIKSNVRDIILSDNEFSLSYIEMKDLSETQAVSLAEKGVVSIEFASNPLNRALLISSDESISIMLCELDHLRIQAVSPGMDFEGAYNKCEKLDNLIDVSSTGYAFDDKLGYLTQCPTDLGTGMRVSVILHLPALAIQGGMHRLSQTISKLGLTLRECFINTSKSSCSFFQLSNQVTLGISEQAAILNLKNIALQLVSQERQARELIVSDDRYIDRIKRSYGILKSAHLITYNEFIEYASYVRLGSTCSVVDADIMKIDRLIYNVQPATMNASLGEMSPLEREKKRAELIQNDL